MKKMPLLGPSSTTRKRSIKHARAPTMGTTDDIQDHDDFNLAQARALEQFAEPHPSEKAGISSVPEHRRALSASTTPHRTPERVSPCAYLVL